MEIKINPLNNGKFDMVGMTDIEIDAYLKLDQTTPQTVINGAPRFDAGLKSNGTIILKSGQKLVFDGA